MTHQAHNTIPETELTERRYQREPGVVELNAARNLTSRAWWVEGRWVEEAELRNENRSKRDEVAESENGRVGDLRDTVAEGINRPRADCSEAA